MSNPHLERILASPDLPTLPVVAMRVLELTSKSDVSLREIAAVIENDPAIAAKVLRTVNSSFYGLTRRCGSIQQALAFLGLQSVKALVLGFSLARSLDGGGDEEVSFDFMDYWRRSIYSAAAAREIALAHRTCDPEEAFVAALVADIGMVALWRVHGDRYLQVVDLAKGDHRRLAALESRSLEIDHATVGAEMTARWRFPESIAAAVRWHGRSHEAEPSVAALARTVELAGSAASVLSTRVPDAELARFRRDGHEWFDLRPGPTTLLLQKIADKADELSRAFGLEVGTAVDVDAILARADLVRREHGLVEPRPADADAEPQDLVAHATLRTAELADARAFGSDLERAFVSACGRGGIGVLLVGVDRARSIQEAFGARGVEAAMDHALAAVRSVEGARPAIYRFVGAELAVLVPHADLEELCRIGEQVRRGYLESPVRFEHAGGGSFPATVTVGAAIYEPNAETRDGGGVSTPDQLVSAAMYALANGRRARNRVVVFHRELAREAQAG